MSLCEDCGGTMKLQIHHESYEPEKTNVLCVGCHQKRHETHGVGLPIGWVQSFDEKKNLFSKRWDESYTYKNLMQEFNISYATVRRWADLLHKGLRRVNHAKNYNDKTLIQVNKKTATQLNLLKRFGETYDDVINRLLDQKEG